MNPLDGKRVYQMAGGWVKKLNGKVLGPFKTEAEAKNAYESPGKEKLESDTRSISRKRK